MGSEARVVQIAIVIQRTRVDREPPEFPQDVSNRVLD